MFSFTMPGARPKLVQCLAIHQRHLPLAPRPPVNASLKSFILNHFYFDMLLHRKAVDKAREKVQHFTHSPEPPPSLRLLLSAMPMSFR